MKKMIFSVIMFLVAFTPFIALALPVGTATLTWDPPTTNSDATLLTDLAGYKLYYGTGLGSYTVNVDIQCSLLPCPGFSTNPPTDLERQQKATSHPTIVAISGLDDNRTWYFAATARDTSANESGYSNEVAKFIPSSVTDSDGDGMTDVWETANGLNPNNAADASQDADGDGLTNLQEFGYNTDPKKVDTDGDGRSDKQEVLVGTNPLSSTSFKSVKNDFNGDGKGDLLDFERHVGASTVFLSTGTAFTSYVPPSPLTNCCHWLYPWMKDSFPGQHEVHVGDFNGDGKDDLLFYQRGRTWEDSNKKGGIIEVALSTGTNFDVPILWNSAYSWVAGLGEDKFADHHKIVIKDVNGDGKDDVVISETHIGAHTVAFSDGAKFVYTPPTPLSNCCHWLYPAMKDSFLGQHEVH